MAIMTPRGLKIRLDVRTAFALIARLWRRDARTDAFCVLKTCEALEDVPAVLACVGALASAYNIEWPAWSIVVAMAAGRCVGVILTRTTAFELLRLSGIISLARIWSWVAGYGLLLLGSLVAVWSMRGYEGIGWWLVGSVVGFLAQMGLEFMIAFHAGSTMSEINFLGAYRLHARRLGVQTDPKVTLAEIESAAWRDCLIDYAVKWPEAVARFPDKAELVGALDPHRALAR